MKMVEFNPALLAPCGMNCGVCYVYLRKKKPCLGCRGEDLAKPDHCRKCNIKTCAAERGVALCVDCADFPCVIIKRLDKSYRLRYQVSLIDNARRLKAVGAPQFLSEEKDGWTCAACGGVISLHDGVCSECGKQTR
jgi:hypothetical protein